MPIRINGRRITEVIIDPHYEIKHGTSVSDVLIVELVKELNGRFELPQATSGEFSYFATLLSHGSKQYRLIWLLEKNTVYVGVINAYRDNRRK
jgi:hypothetical protein